MNFLSKIRPSRALVYAIVSGILVATSYIPFPAWALFFCLCPLWITLLREDNPKKVFLYSWITTIVFTLIGFHWIPEPIVEFGHMPFFVGLAGLVLFAVFSNLHIPLAAVLALLFRKRLSLSSTQYLFTLALLTALFEKLGPQVFPWYFGYSWFYGDFPAYQLADIIGVTGLSTIALLLNAWVLNIYLNIKNRAYFKKQVTYLVLFFSAINLWGMYKAHKWSKTDSEIKVLVVQPNIGNQEKQWEIFGHSFKSKTIGKHFELTNKELHTKPDFILWPETSIPEFLEERFHKTSNVRQVLNYIKEIGVPVITGGFTENKETQKQSNALFSFDKQGAIQGVYKKHILLAFGEYLPFSEFFPSLLKLLPTIADFERGIGPHTITTTLNDETDLKIGPQICYEGLHPWFTAGLVEDGADILINVTNDSWFGHTFESYQHLYMTLMRSVEFRRPMVRATNTGISAVIAANGKILELSPQKKEWAKTVTVPYLKNAPQTFYSKFIYFDHFAVVVALIALLKLYKLSRWRDLFKKW